MFLLKILFSIFFALMVTACATPDFISPNITESELNLAKQEVSLQEMPTKNIETFVEHRKRVEGIFTALRQSGSDVCKETTFGKKQNCDFLSVSVKQNDTVNAYASGKSSITVYTGLIEYTENDDELALVLGHEMAHHLSNHINEDKQNAAIGGVIGAILLGALGAASGDAQLAGDLARDGAELGLHLGALSFSVEQEREADYLGSYLASSAGYDPEKGANFFIKMHKLDPKTGSVELEKAALFDTHPSNFERIARISKVAGEIDSKRSSGSKLLPFTKKQRKATGN